jgi:chemotaxis protein methyltransferase CheR
MAPPGLMTDADFAWFIEYFRQRTGMSFEVSKRYFVDRRVEARVKETRHASCAQYFTYLQGDASQREFETLTNAMTINETYFFREEYQLKAMVEQVMDEVLARKGPGHAIRIWSIPCSTGEEPYSIGMYLLEHWPKIRAVDVEIVGSDINTAVLGRCREGVYHRYAMRELPPAVVKKYFTQLSADEYRISKDLSEAVTFTQLNLSNPRETRRFKDFDLVFCRNLLIYFDDAMRRQTVQTLYESMAPGGHIFLGHSESMSRISSLFEVGVASSQLVYQKPLGGP